MPIRRFRRRPMRPRRRVIRRPRFRRSRIPRPVGAFRKLMTPRSFKQAFNLGAQVIPAQATPGNGPPQNYTFTMSAVPNLNDFQGLFDEYKINRIKIEFTPSDKVNTGSGNIPVIYSVIDFDDSLNLSSPNNALEYESCTKNSVTRYFKKYWTPRIANLYGPVANYQLTTAIVASQPVIPTGSIRAPWLNLNNAASLSVQHYGVKTLLFYPVATTQQFSYNIDVTYYFVLRLIQ
jgi:hypothetical protein